MATINFIYNYPYAGSGKHGRFQNQWSESTKKLNNTNNYDYMFSYIYKSLFLIHFLKNKLPYKFQNQQHIHQIDQHIKFD